MQEAVVEKGREIVDLSDPSSSSVSPPSSSVAILAIVDSGASRIKGGTFLLSPLPSDCIAAVGFALLEYCHSNDTDGNSSSSHLYCAYLSAQQFHT